MGLSGASGDLKDGASEISTPTGSEPGGGRSWRLLSPLDYEGLLVAGASTTGLMCRGATGKIFRDDGFRTWVTAEVLLRTKTVDHWANPASGALGARKLERLCDRIVTVFWFGPAGNWSKICKTSVSASAPLTREFFFRQNRLCRCKVPDP